LIISLSSFADSSVHATFYDVLTRNLA